MKQKSNSVRKILVLALLPTLVISPTNFLDPINWPKQVVLTSVLPLILFELYANFRHLINFRSIEIKIFASSMFLFILSSFLNFQNLTTVFWGTWGRNNGLITYLCLVLLAVVASYFVRVRENVEILVRALALFFFPATLYGLIQIVGRDPLDWSIKNTVFSFFGNTNFASAIFSISTLASIICLGSYRNSTSLKMVYGANGLLASIVMIRTNSIQGPVALMIGIGLWLYFVLRKKREVLAHLYLTLSVSGGLIAFLGFLGVGPLGSILFQYTLKLRSYYWLAGLKMGMQNPIYGVGVDSYGDFYRQNRSLETIKATSIDLTVSNAHNSAIQVFATLGILGLLAYLIIFIPAILFSIKMVIKSKYKFDPDQIAIATLFLSAFSLSMISIDNISVAIPTWMLAGACFGAYFQNKSGELLSAKKSLESYKKVSNFQDKLETLRPVLISSMTAAAFLLSWYSSTPERTIADSYRVPYQSLNQQAKDKFNGSLFNFIESFRILQPSHFSYAIQIFNRDPNYRIIAAKVSDTAVQTFPIDFGLLDLAAVNKENLGRWEEALRLRKQQLDIDYRHPRVRAYFARDLVELKKFSEARSEISLAKKWAKEFSDTDTLQYLETLEKSMN